jgi:hypothetical protein
VNVHVSESDALRSLKRTPEEYRMSAPNADELLNLSNFYTSTALRLSNAEARLKQVTDLLVNMQEQIDLLRQLVEDLDSEGLNRKS